MAGLNKLQMQIWGGQEKRPYLPSLLNFPTGPIDKDYIDLGLQYYFTGAFYVEIDFLYSAVFDGWVGLMGDWTVSGGTSWIQGFRFLVKNDTLLVSISSQVNYSVSKTTSYNTRVTVKMRRDASDNIYFSINGGVESSAGVRAGNCYVSNIGRESSNNQSIRYLKGKIFSFDINGDKYLLTEGSGSKIWSTSNKKAIIKTSNARGLAHIDNDMWEAL